MWTQACRCCLCQHYLCGAWFRWQSNSPCADGVLACSSWHLIPPLHDTSFLWLLPCGQREDIMACIQECLKTFPSAGRHTLPWILTRSLLFCIPSLATARRHHGLHPEVPSDISVIWTLILKQSLSFCLPLLAAARRHHGLHPGVRGHLGVDCGERGGRQPHREHPRRRPPGVGRLPRPETMTVTKHNYHGHMPCAMRWSVTVRGATALSCGRPVVWGYV